MLEAESVHDAIYHRLKCIQMHEEFYKEGARSGTWSKKSGRYLQKTLRIRAMYVGTTTKRTCVCVLRAALPFGGSLL